MTEAPQPLVEVAGAAGRPIELPVGNTGATGYSWTLQLPVGVSAAGETEPIAPPPGQEQGATTGSRLLVAAAVPGEYELEARLARPWESEPLQSLRIRLLVC